MLHLAMKAFYPSKPPFPLLARGHHLEVPRHDHLPGRDGEAARSGASGAHRTRKAWRRASTRSITAPCTRHHEDRGAEAGARQHGFDAAFGGARRDEEKSRAKERIFSFRSSNHRWDPKNQRPELWKLYNARKAKGESMRVSALQLDRARHLAIHPSGADRDRAPLPQRQAPPVLRDGMLIMVDDERFRLRDGEQSRTR
jgi:sulfate adenylyltransferase subunit 2